MDPIHYDDETEIEAMTGWQSSRQQPPTTPYVQALCREQERRRESKAYDAALTAKEGVSDAWSFGCIGFRPDPVLKFLEPVDRVLQLRNRGRSWVEIANQLNLEQYAPPQGERWTRKSAWQIAYRKRRKEAGLRP